MPRRRSAPPKRSLRKRLLIVAAAASCLGVIALAGYAAYLDQQIRSQFEGVRWALPAQVFAQPRELYPGLSLTPDQLVSELRRLGYRQQADISGPGGYRKTGDQLEFYARGRRFWDGEQSPRQLIVRFSRGRVTEMQEAGSDEPVYLHRLDPLLIGSIYPKHGEDRVLVRLEDVPNLLARGVLPVEDKNFSSHFGVDPKGILRALFANVKAGGVVQGGSTITQQLVKNFFLSNERTYRRKVNEALMSILLEVHYDKDEILEAYFNEVYLGQDGQRAVHGFGLASHFYFQKPLQELESQEIALLVAIIKGPSWYDPRRRPERALERRNLVLSLWAEAGLISGDEALQARSRPLGVTNKARRGTTQYPAFVDLVRRQLQANYRDEDLTSEGLQIFTTLDPAVQAVTEGQVAAGLKSLESAPGRDAGDLQAAAIVTSVEGGEILALVGGRSAGFAGFNRALDARRPVGSLLKPAVLLTALKQKERYTLVTKITEEPLQVSLPNGDTWSPSNYDDEYHGELPIMDAVVHSYNVATVMLALELGLDSIVATLRDLGVERDMLAVPSVVLGSIDVAPIDMASMYRTLAAGGYYSPLLAIREVLTRNGEPLQRFPLQIRRAASEEVTFLTTWALEGAMRAGTGRGAYRYLPSELRIAGKTGTTDDLRDSWFAGFGGNRVAVVWVGRDDNKPAGLTGASGALPIWSRIMRDLQVDGLSPVVPPGVRYVITDRETGLRADENCDDVLRIPYIEGSEPTELADCAGLTTRGGSWLRRLFR